MSKMKLHKSIAKDTATTPKPTTPDPMKVYQACVDWYEDTGGCHFCVPPNTDTGHEIDCPLFVGPFYNVNQEDVEKLTSFIATGSHEEARFFLAGLAGSYAA